jgi:hypothetical protein
MDCTGGVLSSIIFGQSRLIGSPLKESPNANLVLRRLQLHIVRTRENYLRTESPKNTLQRFDTNNEHEVRLTSAFGVILERDA